MYYERPDNLRNIPIVSIPFIFMTMVHFFVVLVVKYTTGLDETGYPSTVFSPFVYFSSFFLVLTVVVGVRNKSAGLIDMILGFIVLVLTYLVIS
jgi:hypothetical protein